MDTSYQGNAQAIAWWHAPVKPVKATSLVNSVIAGSQRIKL